jgi:peptide/nickel transport system substrate-binding protein
LLDEQVVTLDETKRKQLVGQIQRLVAEDLPVAMLYTTKFFYVFRKSVFDAWYFTPGGFGPGIPDVYNKHAYITGRQEGLEVRRR